MTIPVRRATAGAALALLLLAAGPLPASALDDGAALVTAAWDRYRSVKTESEGLEILVVPSPQEKPFSRADAEALLRGGGAEFTHKRATRDMLYAADRKDKVRILFSLPADDAGLGFLVWHQADPSADEMYLYMPGYRSVRRVPLSDRQHLAGTDLLYEDVRQLTGEPTSQYSYQTVAEEPVDGRPCDVIVATPRPGLASAYTRRKVWLDRDWKLPRKTEFYDGDELWKVLRNADVAEAAPGVYRAALTEMRDLRLHRATLLLVTRRTVGKDIPAEVFTQDYLEHPGD